MFRLFLICSFLFGAFVFPSDLLAQINTKAYAPDNLSQLSYSERVRVLEKEYYEQSGGRNLPDDQLEFYLDSIDSGWTFSRVKQDIATSLGSDDNNNEDGDWNPGDNWSPRNVICSSIKNRYVECRTPFNGRAVVAQQISKTRCQEGRNWGQRRGMIWVKQGCRARFSETSGGGGWDNGNGNGNGWGNDNNWGNNNYSVTCAGDGGNYRTCAWDPRYGSPRLLQQISRASCIAGRTWGYDNRGLWVSNGCRARFGKR